MVYMMQNLKISSIVDMHIYIYIIYIYIYDLMELKLLAKWDQMEVKLVMVASYNYIFAYYT